MDMGTADELLDHLWQVVYVPEATRWGTASERAPISDDDFYERDE